MTNTRPAVPRTRPIRVNGWGVPDPALPWGVRVGSGIGRSGIEADTEEKTVHNGL